MTSLLKWLRGQIFDDAFDARMLAADAANDERRIQVLRSDDDSLERIGRDYAIDFGAGGATSDAAVVVDGIRALFRVEFDTAEGQASFDLYAVSLQHAEERLVELKETAKIAGEVLERIKA